jgi:uncharacterized membrane protein YeaQ/YmgE (transglycosylase-associated protein family)
MKGDYIMSLVSILLLLLIAAVCGFIGQAIAGVGRGGILVAIVLGFIGALLGTWMASNMGLPELFNIRIEGKSFPILWSIIGSALFVALLSLISRRRWA